MPLTAWFQRSISIMAALAGTLLAIAEAQISPEMLTPVLALVAFVYTDRRGALALSPAWANACGFLAICLAVGEFFGGGIESRLLAGAHLLVYATWIVFFQKKTIALYWWLSALCLLQVAVGAVLMARNSMYGFMAVLYFFVAVWTLSLFSLYQARERLLTGLPGGEGSRRLPETNRWARSARRWEAAWAGGGGLAAAAAQLRADSTVQGSIQFDSHARWLKLRFAAGTFLWGLASLCVGAMFFVLTPRLWIGSGYRFTKQDDLLPGRRQAVTGFADQVRLGQFDSVLTSAEPVFRVRFIDDQTDQAIDGFDYALQLGMDEPLFRGAVLSRYVPSERRWDSLGHEQRLFVDGEPSGHMVRQEIELEPIETNVLFAMHPVRACRVYGRRRAAAAYQDEQTARLFTDRDHARGIRYDAYSPPRRQTDEGDLVTGENSPPRTRDRTATPELGELAALARQVAGYTGDRAHPAEAEMVRRLLVYLRDSQQFQYALETAPTDSASDPIEDFLLRRRTGHCEYFASSLTLMLRAVDIPSRLVSGFKGGEPLGDGVLEVQRRHAHAWVEAWFDGRWHVLDPTPAADRLASVAEMASGGTLADLWREISQWWSEFVVGVDLTQQNRNLYEPLQNGLRNLWESLQEERDGRSLAASIRAFLSSPRRWISWQGGLVTFVLLLVLAGLWWLARRTGRWLKRLLLRLRTTVVHRGRQVEFYERFRRLCERQGLIRAPGQTQREFARDVCGRLQPALAAAGIGEFPARLVDLFYLVRFGEQPLDLETERDIDRWLTHMEQSFERCSKTQVRPSQSVA